jgi:hypothetical protein
MKSNFLTKVFVSLFTVVALCSCSEDEKVPEAAKSTACTILKFSVEGVDWTIGATNINRTYPVGTEKLPHVPSIELPAGATINPSPSTEQNFFTDAGVKYTVTAEDGISKKEYIARAFVTASDSCSIIRFTVDGVDWNVFDQTISYNCPFDTEKGLRTPVITLSEGATISPAASIPQDFFADNGVNYIVTAENKAEKSYNVKAIILDALPCDITGFTVDGILWKINGDSITHIYADTLEALTPVIAVSENVTIDPLPTVPQNFFTDEGVKYTVTAPDGNKKTYIAKAFAGLNSECDIISFSVDGKDWTFAGTNITSTYESTTESMTPIIEVSTNATVSPESGTPQDLFAGVTYTVTAEDGITQKVYTAKASIKSVDEGNTDACTWRITGTEYNYTLTISGNGSTGEPDWELKVDEENRNQNYKDKITTIIIEEGVTRVATVFQHYARLTKVDISASVTFIEHYAFVGCTALTEFIDRNPVAQPCPSGIFEEINLPQITIRVPYGSWFSYDDYDTGWGSIIGSGLILRNDL